MRIAATGSSSRVEILSGAQYLEVQRAYPLKYLLRRSMNDRMPSLASSLASSLAMRRCCVGPNSATEAANPSSTKRRDEVVAVLFGACCSEELLSRAAAVCLLCLDPGCERCNWPACLNLRPYSVVLDLVSGWQGVILRHCAVLINNN